MDSGSIDLTRSAELIVRELLAVKRGEQVAIVCDPQSEMRMANALAGIVEAVGAEFTLMIMPTRPTERKNELTPVIEAGLANADCLIGLTGASGAPTYAASVKSLYDAGQLRGMSMVMRNFDNFTSGGARADYKQLFEEGKMLAAVWKKANRIQISSPSGTDLHATIGGEEVIVECGYATEPGQEAAFSDGEVSQMPNEASAEGRIVVDGPIAHLGLPNEPIELEIAAGRVQSVSGEARQAQALRDILERVDDADNIAEVGIGLNPMCRRNGDFEEEKKALGNVHIALGDNIFYGGSVQSAVHMDMVIYNPTLLLDKQTILENGRLRLPD